MRRRELDEMVAERAVKAGATLWQGAEAIAPVVEGGLLAGAVVHDKDSGDEVTGPRPVRGGRRRRQFPLRRARSVPPGTAPTRSAWRFAAISPVRTTTSPGSRAISTSATGTGNHLPGYGWIFPVGDGTVNVGVGLLSTFQGWKHDQHDAI